MRVAFAIGRPDPAFDPAPHARKSDDVAYWTSSILRDLREACAQRGWKHDMLLLGQEGGQDVKRPGVVVNLLSEPLICHGALGLLAKTTAQHGLKVLNTAAATQRTSRVDLPRLHSEGVTIPLTTWHKGDARELPEHIRSAGHRWPLLLRPPGSHGSLGLRKIDGAELLNVEAVPGGTRVTDFHDFKSTDGLYRKYRMIRVGQKTFRRHLIISDDWNIKGASRTFMVGKPALIDEEKAYLTASGGRAERAVASLFDASGLDFGLIDFARDDAGNIVIFELNGCFQLSGSVPADKMERWGHLEANNGAILDAIMGLIAR